jgi:Putative beta-barrel porin-2, OmpL-like. bbp2
MKRAQRQTTAGRPSRTSALLIFSSWFVAAAASAQPAATPATPAPAEPPTPPDGQTPSESSTPAEDAPNLVLPDDSAEGQVDPFVKIAELEARLDQMQSLVAGRQPRVVLGGYIDLGFFVPEGNGSGIIRDQGNLLFPQYAGRYGWVFLGDILSTAVNSRGEVADLGDPTGAPPRFDSIHSGGAPGFVANEINLNLTSGLGPTAIATASINFTPRSGSNFALGDVFDADIAQLEWMPTRSQKTSIFVGKFDSVLGIEYRDRKSNQRFGITPSLIARYTTGTALGVKVRSKFGPDDLLVLAGSITNGSFTQEQFHFYDEIDTNLGKTASGRVSIHPPIPLDMELGASGSYGPQDRSPNDGGDMWFWGIDYQLHLRRVDLKAQYLRGGAPGDPANDVYGLQLHGGGYLELDWLILPYFGVLGRAEYRDAFVWLGDPNAPGGADRAYLTKSWRGTFGVHINFSDRVALKAEFLHNGEYGGIPQIKNDVFTSSLVLMY